MKADDTDPLLRLLAQLPTAAPDATRAARVRARCHTEVARTRRRRETTRTIETMLVGGLTMAYLLGLVFDLLRWR